MRRVWLAILVAAILALDFAGEYLILAVSLPVLLGAGCLLFRKRS